MPHILVLFLFAAAAGAATYDVGPSQPYATIGAVPWETLAAGDTVQIHWRAAPYREKWVINRTGTEASPITVRGIAGPSGQLPVISGDGATTRSQLSYWGRQRSVIKVGGASVPGDAVASWIVIENLDVASARAAYAYTGPNGAGETYTDTAAAIYVEIGNHITIRNCVMRDSSNGLVTAYAPSSNILISGCYIWGNGVTGSVFQHNAYTESSGITFEYNRFGPLRSGCPGNNLKDRSSGMVVRYNWIEGGSRQLDLVESQNEDLVAANLTNPAYHVSHVYGNVLIEPDGDGNRQIIHYGGDGNEADYRKGTLYLYGNTIVSTRTDRTTLLRLSTNSEHCEARDNIIYVAAAGSTLEMLDDTGTLALNGNWLKQGYTNSFTGAGAVTATGNRTGTAPGFAAEAAQDYALAAGSPCIGTAVVLDPAVLPTHALARQYVKHQSSAARGSAADIGAFPVGTASAAPVITSAEAGSTVTGTTSDLSAAATDDGPASALTYTWSAAGPADVAFSVNGSNAASTSRATFAAAGSYTVTLTVADADGLSTTASDTVTVVQTATSIAVEPAEASIRPDTVLAFSAALGDQFGRAMPGAPPSGLVWSVSGGTVDGAGVYTAGHGKGGPYVVTVTGGGYSGHASVTVEVPPELRTDRLGDGGGGPMGCGGGAIALLTLAGVLRLRSRRRGG